MIGRVLLVGVPCKSASVNLRPQPPPENGLPAARCTADGHADTWRSLFVHDQSRDSQREVEGVLACCAPERRLKQLESSVKAVRCVLHIQGDGNDPSGARALIGRLGPDKGDKVGTCSACSA
jgi:hypothetical protein